MKISIFELVDYLIENASYDVPMDIDEIFRRFSQGCTHSETETAVSALIKEHINQPLFLGIALREKESGLYYVDLPFGETDIVILKSMLMGLNYCEHWQLSEMSRRLDGFLPKHLRENEDIVQPNFEKYGGTFYENVAEIIKALYPAESQNTIYKIQFEYGEYNENLELIPRASHTDNSILRTANPLKIICKNNLFYLITFYSMGGNINFINYRIDRMANVRCTDTVSNKFEEFLSDDRKYVLDLKRRMDSEKEIAKAQNKFYHEPDEDIAALDEARQVNASGFNLSEYLHRSNIMYTDKVIEAVKFRTQKRHLNSIVDMFGFDIDVAPCGESTVEVCVHNVTETTVTVWALQFFDAVEITEPLYIREKLYNAAASLKEKYRGDK